MTRQQDLTLAEWHEVARLLRQAEELVRQACRTLNGRSRKTDPALVALWKLSETIGTVRRGPCENRFYQEHPDEQCGVFCGDGKCKHNSPGHP